MNKLQTYILEIVKYFDEFCKKNDIKYYLMGGSALGAARHNGFIPWDDDFDVFLTLENYNKLVSLKSIFDNSNFCFQPINTPENKLFMGKIRMKNTLLIEGNGDNYDPTYCHGIYVDIMILFDSPRLFFSKAKQFLYAKILSANRLSLDGYKANSMFKKIFIKYSNKAILKNGIDKYLNYITKARENRKQYCHIFGRASFKKSYYNKNWFDGDVRLEFENLMLPLMKEYDKYLTLRYGSNYMAMPSKKTIDSYPSHAVYVNYDGEFLEKKDKQELDYEKI